MLRTPLALSAISSVIVLDLVLLFISHAILLIKEGYPCNERPNGLMQVEEVISVITVIFICFFMLEMILKLTAFGLLYFLHPLHGFELFVTIMAFILEVILPKFYKTFGILAPVTRILRLIRLEMFTLNATHIEKIQLHLKDLPTTMVTDCASS
jgi:hypothetical protein